MAAAAPFAMKAIPMVGSLVGGLFGKKLSGPSKEQQAGMDASQQASKLLSGYSQPLMSQGMGAVQQGMGNLGAASRYYQGVMGSRGQALSHLNPEITQILDFYRGGSGSINRNLRGGSRDYALAEMQREKTGQLASLVPNARRDAAGNLGQLGGVYGQLGTALSGQGINAAGTSGQLGNQLFGMASDIQKQQTEGGKSMGGFIFDLLKNIPGMGGSGGGGGSTGLAGMPASYSPQLLSNQNISRTV